MPSNQSPLLEAEAPAPSQAMQTTTQEPSLLTVIERLAGNPSASIDVIERLIAAQERVNAHQAKAAFDAAFAKMQPSIPVIDEKGRIKNKDGQSTRSTYAKLEDIHKVIKPILAEHGFAVRHRTEWPEEKKNIIRIVGILSHEQGHSEESVFEAPMDRSDYRTDIQSQGSTISYGRRYTTIDLLNISTRAMDDDGESGKRTSDVKAPEGYDAWLAALDGVAGEGSAAFDPAFEKSKQEFREHLARTDPKTLARLRTKARAKR